MREVHSFWNRSDEASAYFNLLFQHEIKNLMCISDQLISELPEGKALDNKCVRGLFFIATVRKFRPAIFY